MRRIILAATTGALLLTASACGDTKSDTDTAAAPATPTVTASASPTADYTEDTEKVCGKIKKIVVGKNMKTFAEELAKYTVFKEANATAEAKKARVGAEEGLKDLGKALNDATAEAKDPELKAAGEETLRSMTSTAEDDAWFKKLKTEKDLDKALETGITEWLTPLDNFCG
ncbi:hypothetical protein AB0M36_29635 [Actinoplanes sp. NPDC051346]|uniref:hypothetical protein n=1 Tax=Actinoplanes sp. NPDC051346 TaxID=3155048 RepID=UPI0034145A9D